MSGVRQGCIMSPWLFNVDMGRVIKEVKMGMGSRGMRFLEDDLVLCGETKEDLRGMVEQFAGVCRRRGLKVNAGKSKVIVLDGEEGLEYEVYIDGIHVEHVLEFKYLGYVFDESGTVQMDNLRGLLGIRRVDRVLNTWLSELYEVKKGLDGRIDESMLWWFSHVKRMEDDRIAKRVYVGECASSSVGRS